MQAESPSNDTVYEVDSAKTDKYRENYLFCRFHHLFEYEATYYSYLIAKLCSRKLFNEGLSSAGTSDRSKTQFIGRGEANLSRRETQLIFEKGGETTNYERAELLKF